MKTHSIASTTTTMSTKNLFWRIILVFLFVQTSLLRPGDGFVDNHSSLSRQGHVLAFMNGFDSNESSPLSYREATGRKRSLKLSAYNKHPPSSPADDTFRSIRRNLPKRAQYFLRDSGLLRFAIDTGTLLTAKEVIESYPSAFEDFLQLSGLLAFGSKDKTREKLSGRKIDFQRFEYGKHSRQIIDLISPHSAVDEQDVKKREELIVFLHGGAWGSGFPLMYRLAAKPFVKEGYPVAIVGYRTYPSADVVGQIEDVANALEFLYSMFHLELSNNKKIIFVGHSSGAHLGALGILRGELSVDAFIGVSGVYDIPSHYIYERSRGIERCSPLAPACGGSSLYQWKANSPTRLAKALSSLSSKKAHLPPMLFIHGENDTTVPYTSSMNIALLLQQVSCNGAVALEVLPDVEHIETALHLMFGGSTSERVLGWLSSLDCSCHSTPK